MKRLFCILTTLLIVLSMTGCSKKDEVKIFVKDSEAKAGSKIEVPVNIKNNPGIMAFFIDFDYDTAVLEFVEIKKSGIFTDFETVDKNSGIRVSCIENNDVKKDGEMMILVFNVIGEKGDKTELKPLIDDNSFCNYNEELISGVVKGATIKIK